MTGWRSIDGGYGWAWYLFKINFLLGVNLEVIRLVKAELVCLFHAALRYGPLGPPDVLHCNNVAKSVLRRIFSCGPVLLS